MRTRARSWFKQLSNHYGFTAVVFFLTFIFSALFFYHVSPFSNRTPAPLVNLAGPWELCLPHSPDPSGCSWKSVRVPADIPKSLLSGFKGWAIYRTHFSSPDACLSKAGACAFFFREVGDAVEAQLNGHEIGRHGQFPPNPIYAKHYPVTFQVSRDSLRPGLLANELVLIVYSMQKVQAGVRAPPVGLYRVEDAFRLAQMLTTMNVLLPILSFVGLFMIGLLSFAVAGPRLNKDRRFLAFLRFCFVTACFLLSISEVPREYLPIGVAGYLHVTLRILHDWTFFEMVAVFFDYSQRFVRIFRGLYLVTVGAFVVEFFYFSVLGEGGIYTGHGFDIGFLTLRIAFPLLALPHLMGTYGGYRRLREWEGKICVLLFGTTFLFQIRDTAIFDGFMSGTYYVKWYPVIIGLVFGLFFLYREREARAKDLAEEEKVRQMAMIHHAVVGVSHDLEEPLKGLEMACSELGRNPGNRELVRAIADEFPGKLQRIYELNKSILSFSKELSTELVLEKAPYCLYRLAQSVAEEYREQPDALNVDIQVTCRHRSAVAVIDAAQVRRVLRNLVRNAIQACAGRTNSKVDIVISRLERSGVEVMVTDNGPGIAPEIRERLFQPFETFGKKDGTGLGLALSRRLVDAHGGSLMLVASDVGASFRIIV